MAFASALAKVQLQPFAARLTLIPQEHVAKVWPLGLDFLKAAERENSLQSVDGWLGDCINGRAQLWLVWSDADTCEGAVVTSLVECPEGKLCIINAFGGALAHLDQLPIIEAWARDEGCRKVRLYGRSGWKRVLKSYAPIGVIMDKGL